MELKFADTVFAGFGILRREPLSVLAWFGAYVVFTILLMVVMSVLSVASMASVAGADAAALNPGAILGRMAGVFVLVIPLSILFGAIVQGAVYRAVLRPEERGWARMRFGGDELRMAGLNVIIFIAFFICYFISILLAALVGGIMAMLLGPFGVVLAVAVVIFALLSFYTFVSLMGPMTFAKRRFILFESTDLVRRKFWPLMGCYAVLGLVIFLLYLVTFGVVFAIMGAASGGFDPQALARNSVAAGNYGAASIGILVMSTVVGALMVPVMFAPAAVAYRDMAGPEVKRQADVFS